MLLLAAVLAATLGPARPARAQADVQAARRRLQCAQLGVDFTDPLGRFRYQRCLQGGPAAMFGPRVAGPVPQLVTPVGPLVKPVGPLVTPAGPLVSPARTTPAPGTARPAGDGCRQGFVWREAVPGDHVCVVPDTRRQAWADNAAAAVRVNPVDHSYGPDTCRGGFVWREATAGDHVCVPPALREQARGDNAAAGGRVAR